MSSGHLALSEEERAKRERDFVADHTNAREEDITHIICSENPEHSLRYGWAGKGEASDLLAWDATGRPLVSVVGYVVVIFHTAEEIVRLDPIHVVSNYARGTSYGSGRKHFEGEVDFLEPVPATRILFRFPLIAPDFSQQWNVNMKRWYGYSKPTKNKTSRWPACQRACADGTINANVVAEEIAKHQSKLLDAEAAYRVSRQHDGQVVFLDVLGGFWNVCRRGNDILATRDLAQILTSRNLTPGGSWDNFALWGRRHRQSEHDEVDTDEEN